MRIKARWEAIDKESTEMCYAKSCSQIYKPSVFENGDSLRQLLARSRYLLFKKETSWSSYQAKRAAILFREYPKIKKAYYLALHLVFIYHQSNRADVALTKLAHWYE